VADSTLSDGGWVFPSGTAVFVQGNAAKVSIEHNDIYEFSYTAISLGWSWSYLPQPLAGEHTIRKNRIHHLGFPRRETGDAMACMWPYFPPRASIFWMLAHFLFVMLLHFYTRCRRYPSGYWLIFITDVCEGCARGLCASGVSSCTWGLFILQCACVGVRVCVYVSVLERSYCYCCCGLRVRACTCACAPVCVRSCGKEWSGVRGTKERSGIAQVASVCIRFCGVAELTPTL
jgi:hypothetical protein